MYVLSINVSFKINLTTCIYLLSTVSFLLSGCVHTPLPDTWPPTVPGKNEWVDRGTGHKVIRL